MPPFRSFLEAHYDPSLLTRLQFAAEVYRQRNLPPETRKIQGWQKNYPLQPVGYYLAKQMPEMKQAIWLPHPLEVRPCCWTISTPAHKHPHGWHRHCRTLVHVATICNVDLRELRNVVQKPRERCAMCKGRFARKGTDHCGHCAFVHRLDDSSEAC